MKDFNLKWNDALFTQAFTCPHPMQADPSASGCSYRGLLNLVASLGKPPPMPTFQMSPHLVIRKPIPVSRWMRFKLRLEALSQRADVRYPFEPVATVETVPDPNVYRLKGEQREVYLCHPATWQRLKDKAGAVK